MYFQPISHFTSLHGADVATHSFPALNHSSRNPMHVCILLTGWWMGQVSGKVGWVPPSYLKKVDKGDSTEGESDSDDEYLGPPGCKLVHVSSSDMCSV